jgi:hypothetical protein
VLTADNTWPEFRKLIEAAPPARYSDEEIIAAFHSVGVDPELHAPRFVAAFRALLARTPERQEEKQ